MTPRVVMHRKNKWIRPGTEQQAQQQLLSHQQKQQHVTTYSNPEPPPTSHSQHAAPIRHGATLPTRPRPLTWVRPASGHTSKAHQASGSNPSTTATTKHASNSGVTTASPRKSSVVATSTSTVVPEAHKTHIAANHQSILGKRSAAHADDNLGAKGQGPQSAAGKRPRTVSLIAGTIIAPAASSAGGGVPTAAQSSFKSRSSQSCTLPGHKAAPVPAAPATCVVLSGQQYRKAHAHRLVRNLLAAPNEKAQPQGLLGMAGTVQDSGNNVMQGHAASARATTKQPAASDTTTETGGHQYKLHKPHKLIRVGATIPSHATAASASTPAEAHTKQKAAPRLKGSSVFKWVRLQYTASSPKSGSLHWGLHTSSTEQRGAALRQKAGAPGSDAGGDGGIPANNDTSHATKAHMGGSKVLPALHAAAATKATSSRFHLHRHSQPQQYNTSGNKLVRLGGTVYKVHQGKLTAVDNTTAQTSGAGAAAAAGTGASSMVVDTASIASNLASSKAALRMAAAKVLASRVWRRSESGGAKTPSRSILSGSPAALASGSSSRGVTGGHTWSRKRYQGAGGSSINKQSRRPQVLCSAFCKTGKCKRHAIGRCKLVHDPTKVWVCTKWLQGRCDSDKCSLQHKVVQDLMPVCSFFLKGACSSADCPYLHVNYAESTPVCTAFNRGYCPLGAACSRQHVRLHNNNKKVRQRGALTAAVARKAVD